MKIAILTIAALAPAVATAQAQPALSASEARAYAENLIENAGAGAVFANVTDSATPTTRHDPSGLVCRFDPLAEGNFIRVFPPASYSAPTGDDVGCNTSLSFGKGRLVYTLYATRYPASVTVQAALANAEGEIKAVYQTVEPWSEAARTIVPADGDNPKILSSRFTITYAGARLFSKISVAQIDGWTLMLRASTDIAAGKSADAATDASFASSLRDVAARQTAIPR